MKYKSRYLPNLNNMNMLCMSWNCLFIFLELYFTTTLKQYALMFPCLDGFCSRFPSDMI